MPNCAKLLRFDSGTDLSYSVLVHTKAIIDYVLGLDYSLRLPGCIGLFDI